jgi:hypothetical protein
MTPVDRLKADLVAAGWHIYKDGTGHHRGDGCNWYAGKRPVGATECASNRKPPSVVVYPWALEFSERTHYSAEIELCGAVNNEQWVKYIEYSIPMGECMQRLPIAVERLIKAWNAVADGPKETEV